jgi:tetratricopeptide (TPR) repeat protein
VLARVPDHSAAHVGLANACAMQFEMTRADPHPDRASLELAVHHARESCRLDVQSGESWATLGFVLERLGQHTDALAAARRAVSLEPQNWRHQLRLAYTGWGEERLRAAQRTLSLLPGFPLAYWLIGTVYVARGASGEAGRALDEGIASAARLAAQGSRFTAVALHWLRGLIWLADGEEAEALEHFERELALESGGHLYAREVCANTWYAIGAVRLRQHRRPDASAAFERTLQRVEAHPLAKAALAALQGAPRVAPAADARRFEDAVPMEAALAAAVQHVLAGEAADAARVVAAALSSAQPGSAGWILPVEPILNTASAPDLWAPVLARIRAQAA